MTAQKPIFKAIGHEPNSFNTSTTSSTPFSKSSPKNNAQVQSHFINITDALCLDDSSKNQVRVQVMKEYHRRRKQGKTSKVQSRLAPKDTPSAKSQIQKFRLGQEKILRPWVRVKPYVSKKVRVATPSTKTDGSRELGKGNSHGSERTLKKRSPHPSGVKIADYNCSTITDFRGDTSEIELLQPGSEEPIAAVQQWLKSSLEAYSPYNSPATGVLDPFSAMSLLITPRTQLLLHHYFNVRLASSWLMMPMRKGLFSLAVHDSALFHTFLSHYVASYNLRLSTGDPAESMQHRTEAIRIVNERLQDPTQALSDGTIAAVANMAVYESSNGSPESMVVHLNGLVEMVNMRGGIENGGFAPHVRRLIGWTDLHVASALSSKPRFPPLSIPLTLAPDSTSLPFPVDSAPSNTQTKYQSLTLSETLFQIRNLSFTMSTLRAQSVLPEENIWFSDKIYSVQHRLFDILHNPCSSHGTLDASICLAALIFCAVCLRDITFNFRIIYNGVKRLKVALKDFLDRHWKPCVEYEMGVKLFWVLGMGGIASEGKEEREWFVGKFEVMCGVLNLGDWEAARDLLARVLWQEDLDGFGRKLWAEATAP